MKCENIPPQQSLYVAPATTKVLLLWILTFLLIPSAQPFAVGITPREIMQKVDSKKRARTLSASTEMILIGNNGQRRSRKMQTYSTRDELLTKKSLFFVDPAEVRGTALLTFDYNDRKREDEQWIYLPALHRSKRISAGNRSGSFMGSDFSYGDLMQKSIDSFTYTLLKEQQQEAHTVWIIEATPKNDTIQNLYGYSKSLLLVRQDNHLISRAIYWLNDAGYLKYNEVKRTKEVDGVWVPLEVHAKTVKNGKTVHQTIIINSDIVINQPIDDEFFTLRRLEKGL